jgi:hypothetical protein
VLVVDEQDLDIQLLHKDCRQLLRGERKREWGVRKRIEEGEEEVGGSEGED